MARSARERKTKQRVVGLFREQLGYDYLGERSDREDNRNIEEALLGRFLREKQGYDDALITRALYLFTKTAGDTSKSSTTATAPSMRCSATG